MMKAKIVERSMKKRQTENPFDIVYADNYKLPPDAENAQNNSHYFFLTDFKTGETMFVRSAMRGGTHTDELWFMYCDGKGNIMLAEKDHVAKGEKNPVRVECAEAGKTMRFYYDGNVVPAVKTDQGYVPKSGAKPQKLTMEGEFDGTSGIFEFSTHMSPKLMSRAISREKFTRSFQETMGAIHQIHYEQSGRATAVIKTDGREITMKDVVAARDHSFGKREWDYFDRYIWTICVLENGDFIHTSMMRYPAISYLQAGFHISGDRMTSMLKSTEMDELPTLGTTPPTVEIVAEYVDGKRRVIRAKEDFKVPYLFDDDFKVVEGVYDYDVDGVRGRGIVEFSFNRDKSRWSRPRR